MAGLQLRAALLATAGYIADSVLELHLHRFLPRTSMTRRVCRGFVHRQLTAVNGPVPSTGGADSARVGGVLDEELLLGHDLERLAASSSDSHTVERTEAAAAPGIHHRGQRARCLARSSRWQAASSEGRARKAARSSGASSRETSCTRLGCVRRCSSGSGPRSVRK
ncbi:hypothetical protein ACQJBY_018985 [Aegilops geniculata]